MLTVINHFLFRQLKFFFLDTGIYNNDNTFNEYHFQKHMNIMQNTIDANEHDLEDKKNNLNTFFPPLH